MTQCKTCDRREATDEEWETVQPGGRADLCWGEHLGCSAHRVDWRERALAAERERSAAMLRGEALLELLSAAIGVSNEAKRMLEVIAERLGATTWDGVLVEISALARAAAERDALAEQCRGLAATLTRTAEERNEARRERDKAREAAGSDKLHLFGELKNARAREASERTWRERAEAQRDAAEAETFAARSELCALLDGHLSPSDAVRAASITRATAARRGWGM